VKTYQPGNLKNSIDVLSFRRSEAVFVGPRMGRRSVGFDGYYAGWIEKGTKHIKPWHFIRDGAAASGPWALERLNLEDGLGSAAGPALTKKRCAVLSQAVSRRGGSAAGADIIIG
jgi:hypothetical protein